MASPEALDVATPSVDAGPSQCQWSPWGSQPVDSLGLGTAGVTLLLSSSVVEVAVSAGPSQCLSGLVSSRGIVKWYQPVVTVRFTANGGRRRWSRLFLGQGDGGQSYHEESRVLHDAVCVCVRERDMSREYGFRVLDFELGEYHRLYTGIPRPVQYFNCFRCAKAR